MKTKHRIFSLFGIFSLYFALCQFTIMTPAIDTLAKTFNTTPMTTIMLANTVTGLVTVAVSILAGMVVHKVGYRRMAICGLLISMLGGMYPYFLSGIEIYYPIIISRALAGVGLGMISPLGGALIINFFSGKQQETFLGIGNVIFYLGGFVFQTVAGFLCTVGWNYTFLSYLLALISLVFVFIFLPEPDKETVTTDVQASQTDLNKEKTPSAVFGYVLLILIVQTLIMPSIFLTSVILAEGNLGHAGIAGIVNSMYSIGGMCSGAIFMIFLKLLRKTFISMTFFGFTLGLGLIYYGNAVFLIGTGVFLCGFSWIAFFTAMQAEVGRITPKNRLGFANGWVMAAMNFGTFTTTYYIAAAQNLLPNLGTKAPLLTSGILFLAGAVVFFIIGLRKPPVMEANITT